MTTSSSGVLALQNLIGNRATGAAIGHNVQRHPGQHPAPDGHTTEEHDEQGRGPPFVPLVTMDDPVQMVNQTTEVLDMVRSLRPDAEAVAAGQDPAVFQPTGMIVYFEDYIITTDSRGRIQHVLEQDPDRIVMSALSVVFLREPGTTRLWTLGWVGERFRAHYLRNHGGVPLDGVPAGVSTVLAFAPGLLLGPERAASMTARARGRPGSAAEAPAWAHEASQGAGDRRRNRRRRRERDRRQRAQEQSAPPGGPGGADDGSGSGVRGTGRGGGGDASNGVGTGSTGQGTGRATDSDATGRGR
ncbi:MAG: hypothetical protein OEZ14_12450, partial [Acidimicrobiia bacterium]|nr:hypothetical protein [Acidimicrobiia bacterium]